MGFTDEAGKELFQRVLQYLPPGVRGTVILGVIVLGATAASFFAVAGSRALLGKWGDSYMERGERSLASKNYLDAVAAYTQAGTFFSWARQPAAEVDATIATAEVAALAGKDPQAIASSEHAIELAHATNYSTGEGAAFEVLGRVLQASGDLEKSANALTNAVRILKEAGEQVRAGNAMSHLVKVGEQIGWPQTRLRALDREARVLRGLSEEDTSAFDNGDLYGPSLRKPELDGGVLVVPPAVPAPDRKQVVPPVPISTRTQILPQHQLPISGGIQECDQGGCEKQHGSWNAVKQGIPGDGQRHNFSASAPGGHSSFVCGGARAFRQGLDQDFRCTCTVNPAQPPTPANSLERRCSEPCNDMSVESCSVSGTTLTCEYVDATGAPAKTTEIGGCWK